MPVWQTLIFQPSVIEYIAEGFYPERKETAAVKPWSFIDGGAYAR